jgi:hypothetical protein
LFAPLAAILIVAITAFLLPLSAGTTVAPMGIRTDGPSERSFSRVTRSAYKEGSVLGDRVGSLATDIRSSARDFAGSAGDGAPSNVPTQGSGEAVGGLRRRGANQAPSPRTRRLSRDPIVTRAPSLRARPRAFGTASQSPRVPLAIAARAGARGRSTRARIWHENSHK